MKLPKSILLIILSLITFGVCAQTPNVIKDLQLLGTRSWIRINWDKGSDPLEGYRIYWSTDSEKPNQPNMVLGKEEERYYIKGVLPETQYHIWVEAYSSLGASKTIQGQVKSIKNWQLDEKEISELKNNPSSKAVPQGMQLFWQDEFNDELLNRNKWSTNYYTSIDHLNKIYEADMRAENLPQPAFKLNGKTINLFVNDALPERVYDRRNQKKISSIQTYDWRTDENHLDNSRGGYFEVKVRRSSTGKPKGLNTAFWFDSPGPDLRNYLEQGTTLNHVKGIRPKGQVFEIDIFEYINAQFVLHGHVDENGKFQHNLATHIAEGYTHVDNWVTHGILWTPNSIKHYINGDLIREYTDRHKIYSPNHFMNVFLGSYGSGGTVNMEVDYIRGYQWPLIDGNELPNPNFQDNESLSPWEGTAQLISGAGKDGSKSVVLKPGQHIEQYVYLDNDTDYRLEYWFKGEGTVKTTIDNVTLVSGELDRIDEKVEKGKDHFTKRIILFKTGEEHADYMKTIRISFENIADTDMALDDITAKKDN